MSASNAGEGSAARPVIRPIEAEMPQARYGKPEKQAQKGGRADGHVKHVLSAEAGG